MSNNKLTKSQLKLVLEALYYYRDNATQPNSEYCGLTSKKEYDMMTKAIRKLEVRE